MPVEPARLPSSLPVEIIRRLLDEPHPLLEHGLELIGRGKMRGEIDCRFASAICAIPAHYQTPLRLTYAIHKAREIKSSYEVQARSIWCSLRTNVYAQQFARQSADMTQEKKEPPFFGSGSPSLTGRRQTEWTGATRSNPGGLH